MNETSLSASSVASPSSSASSAGRSIISNSPAKARREPVVELVALDRGEEADGAEVDPEDRHAGARVVAQRVEDRAVAAEHEAEVGRSRAAPRRPRCPPRRRRAWRARRRSATSASPASLGGGDRRAHRLGRLLGGWEWVIRRRGTHGSAPRSIAASTGRRARLDPAARQHQRKVSRLPFGPGQARRRRSRARPGPSPRAASATARGSPRGGRPASRTTPPLPTRSRPSSNCGLTIARISPPGARQRGDRRQHLGQRDEGDVDGGQRRARRAGRRARARAR